MTINFNLKINIEQKKVTFFSLPTSNNYQQIINLSYNADKAKLLIDKFHGNKILAITSTAENIKFKIALKPQKIQLDNLSFNFSNEQKKLIKRDGFIDGEDIKISEIANSLKNSNFANTIKNSYKFVLDYLTYGNPQEGLYSYKQALDEKITDCGGFSTLLASILNASNIPTRLVVGFLIKKNLSTKLLYKSNFALGFNNLSMHAWIEALLPDDTWFPMDPSIDWKRRRGLTTREGGFGSIPADRLVTSFGENFELNFNGKDYNISILQTPLSYNL